MNKHCTALNNISTYPHSHSPPSLVPSLIAGIGTAVDDGHQFQFVGVLQKSFDDRQQQRVRIGCLQEGGSGVERWLERHHVFNTTLALAGVSKQLGVAGVA
mgnify:FL=1